MALCVAIGNGSAPALASEPATRELTRAVFGFFDEADRDYMLNTADYDVLSTVAYFALEAQSDGSLLKTAPGGANTIEWNAWTSTWMGDVIALAHAHVAKVVLTVARFGWSPATRAATIALLANAAARQRLAQEVADAVVARGADGVNLDLEPMFAGYQEQFVDLLRRLRTELDARQPGLSLTFDSTGYGSHYPIAAATAAGAADAVFVMAYPFRTKFSDKTGAISPMAGVRFDVTEAVDRACSKATCAKVILGLPNFGYEWPTETKRVHSLTRKDWERYGFPQSVSLADAASTAARYGRRWDAQQLVPWTRWRARACAGCPRTWRQVYYDDTHSMTIKYDFVNERDLLGIGIWQLGRGEDRADFYSLMRDKFGPSRAQNAR